MLYTLLLTAFAFAFGWQSPSAEPVAAADAPASIALVTTFSDGRATYQLVSRRSAWSWTPQFPRIASWRLPDGALPIVALKVTRQLVDEDVSVRVSVLRGSSHQQEDEIDTVSLRGRTPVTIDKLRGVGLEPIVLSLVDVSFEPPFLPSVKSVTPELEFSSVEVRSSPYPGYHVTVRNLSQKSIATFTLQTYRGASKALSTVRAGTDGRPAMRPGDSYSFDVNLTGGIVDGTGNWSPTPLDLIEVEAVLWADGTTSGQLPNIAPRAIPGDAGSRITLARAIEILRAAASSSDSGSDMLQRVRAGFEALPTSDDSRLEAAQASMRATRTTVLEDLRQFEGRRSATHEADEVRLWIQSTIQRYESWIRRLSPV